MQAKRSLLCTYLRTNAMSEQNPTWSLIGNGFSTNSISYEPDSEDNQYINQDSATTILKRYKPTMSLEGVIEMTKKDIKSSNESIEINGESYEMDPVFAYVNNLRRTREISNETEILIVELYTGNLNKGANVFENCNAQRQKVNMQVDEFGGDAGDTISFSATVNFQGDPTNSSDTYNVLNTSERTLISNTDKVTVTYDGEHTKAIVKPLNAYKDYDLSATFKADGSYHLPDTVTVKNGASTLAVNTDYSYNKVTGVVTVKGSKITDAITITCTGVSNT